mmetsp:Transcript_58794/g.132472  ORF Transcript_58794/g.132472 Transcript_58794/m.132472 type:complete len:194 (+) Transcript_58794:37-618(+)|eukprot:CAMPEP_0197911126 /NCGR_PEP_ID=MMETSP1439-20131203/72238_1 /TAXON_ID=66791 /ORGANISM="Gonyaulax spinifera, Strain CCMP409" /LENGTH=193 /DNA_ID=CAMNT_0043532837 /DNA_START=30 /DNA_END=611 /DNA_ORIENTATION=+
MSNEPAGVLLVSAVLCLRRSELAPREFYVLRAACHGVGAAVPRRDLLIESLDRRSSGVIRCLSTADLNDVGVRTKFLSTITSEEFQFEHPYNYMWPLIEHCLDSNVADEWVQVRGCLALCRYYRGTPPPAAKAERARAAHPESAEVLRATVKVKKQVVDMWKDWVGSLPAMGYSLGPDLELVERRTPPHWLNE